MSQDDVGAVALFKTVLDFLDKLNLLSFHVTYLIRKSSGLTGIVLHVLIHVMLTSGLLIVKLCLLSFDTIFVHLKLSLFFAHLMGQFLKHGNLLASFLIHNCRLLADLRAHAVLRAQTLWLPCGTLLQLSNTVLFGAILITLTNAEVILHFVPDSL